MTAPDELDPKERWPDCECNYCQADEHWWTELIYTRDIALTAARERIARLEGALHGVLRVADRATDEFDAARAALSPSTPKEPT